MKSMNSLRKYVAKVLTLHSKLYTIKSTKLNAKINAKIKNNIMVQT